jgi:hypothetical protein
VTHDSQTQSIEVVVSYFRVDRMLTLDEVTHEYRADGQRLISVTQVLDAHGLYRGTDWMLPEHREYGHAVHLACEYHDRGSFEEFDWDPIIFAPVESWREFKRATGFKPILIEEKMASKIYRFAGRPDVVGWIGDELWIIDRKTGGIQKCSKYQTGGYHLLLLESDFWKSLSPKPIVKRGGVMLSKEGKQGKLDPHNDRNDIAKFCALLAAAQIRKEVGL